MNKIYTILMATAIASLPVMAQKPRKAIAVKKPLATQKLTKKEMALPPYFKQMLDATQKVMIADSVVVSKNDFLAHYIMNPESGSLMPYSQFFHVDEQPNAYVYLNGMGNKCIYSFENADGTMELYTRDKLGEEWGEPQKLNIMDSKTMFTSMNYPFLMADGTTLYFAAQGKESLGGYDIYVTRYDDETKQYLKPENIGMPFNSTANDYMYAVDEMDSIGWFATDRHQSGNEVCLYIFEPSESRNTYFNDGLTEQEIKPLADISNISATWHDTARRQLVLDKIAAINKRNESQSHKADFHFVVNDNITYTHVSDFHAPGNQTRVKAWMKMQQQYNTMNDQLQKSRDYYGHASAQDRASLRTEILNAEKQVEQMQLQIRQMEKDIRQAELAGK